MYKTELHVHTCPASKCAHTEPEEMIEQYIENGYSTVVITNHMSPTLFDVILPDITDYKEAAKIFLEDIRRARGVLRRKNNGADRNGAARQKEHERLLDLRY